jgi:hypothetical protein
MLKKIIKGFFIGLIILIGIAIAIPYVFKNKIIALVKKEINKNLNAKVDFKDVNISFFRHFPKVAIGIENLQVIGLEGFSADTLLFAKRIDAAVNFMSIIKGSDMTIYSVYLEHPRINAIVNKDGKANWDIVKKDEPTSDSTSNAKPFTLQLKKYAIEDGFINYVDKSSNIFVKIEGIEHTGKGNFSTDLFTLQTKTAARSVTFINGVIPYLLSTKVNVNAAINVNNKENIYSFNTDEIALNDLKISGQGQIKNIADSGYEMDIKFNAPSTDFKNMLSLISGIYKSDFDKVKATGTAMFSGFVKGIYNDKRVPAYHIDLVVKDGFFQYADLPKPVKHINFKTQVDNPDGVPDNMVVNIEQGHLELENEPLDFRLLIKKPVTQMFVDAAAKGKLDLSKIPQFIKLEKDTKLAGLLNADITILGPVNAIQNAQYDKFNASGTVAVNNFIYQSKDYPAGVTLSNVLATFNPRNILLSNINGQYLSSTFSGNAQVNNFFNYLLQNKALNGSANLSVDNINLNDWMGEPVAASPNKNVAAPSAFVVPKNINFLVNAKVDKLHYDKVDIQALSGNMQLADETITLKEVKGNALGGTMAINGAYSTKQNKLNPDVSLQYNVTGLDVQQTFNAFNTVQKLMPIGKFIAGKLTSQMSLNGKLGQGMSFDFSSLSGNGNLLLIEGLLSKFAPLEKIASTLHVKQLEQIALKDVRSYFEFTNGKVLVKPFPLKLNNIEMEIGGMQSLDQSLAYVINMKLPRSLMGEKGNQLVNSLSSQLSAKGLPVKLSDVVNLHLKLGGSFTNPTVKVDLQQGAASLADEIKQQATDFAKAKIDSTKQAITNAAKDTIASIKKQAIENAKEAVAKKILGNKNSNQDSLPTKPKPQESVKGLLDNLFKKKKDTIKNP